MDATLYCALKAAFHRGFEVSTDAFNGGTQINPAENHCAMFDLDDEFDAWLQTAYNE